ISAGRCPLIIRDLDAYPQHPCPIGVPTLNSEEPVKVDIPWRKTSSVRNQAWEVDRALHAAAVYVKLIEWRQQILLRDDLSDDERNLIEESLGEAVEAAHYLVSQLRDSCSSSFGASGLDLLDKLARRLSIR
ncbi:hypothetical protein, partial [Brevibacterium otitidis]